MRHAFSASERIPNDEITEDSRSAANIATAISAHAAAGYPAICRHIRRVTYEDGITIQTICCEPL